MKTLTVIGAGISGLTCAIYAQRSGIKTTILEKAAGPGGVSTSWKRKGYTFEGGIHWLIGSRPGLPLHDVWTETGALGANNPLFYKDPVYTLIDGDTVLELPRSAKKMYKALGAFSPKDKAALAVLRFHVWCFTFFHTPILDLGGLKVRHPRRFSLTEFLKMGPAVLLTPYLMSISAGRYIKRFRNPHVRRLLEAVVDPRINALSLIYTLSTFDDGDGGYPEGGSLRMSQNMADTFTSLGGQIQYRTAATGVRESSEGVSVLTEGGSLRSDAVVISSDARSAIDKLFPEPLQTRWAKRLRNKLHTAQCMFVAIGIKADLSDCPRCMHIVLKRPLEAGGLRFEAITVNNYAREDEYAPEGCTTLTCILPGASYHYWKAVREEGEYKQRKQEVIADFISRIEEELPQTRGLVEATDLATPLTWERYCDTFEGSYMSDWMPWHFNANAPIRFRPGIFFTGQRTAFSGGLPVAAETGRRTAQILCKSLGVEFVSRSDY